MLTTRDIKLIPCGLYRENAYLVCPEGRDDCVLIDPGDDLERLRAALAGKKLGAILLTHGHFDHIMAVGPMAVDTHAPVYVGRDDMEMLNNAALNGRAGLMGITHMDGPAIEAAPYGEKLSAAGLDFTVLSTPGHSRGSVCLYLPDENVLFSGDTLFQAGFGRMDLYGGSPAQMRNSLRRLFALPPETRVYPGHGMATTIGDERSRYGL